MSRGGPGSGVALLKVSLSLATNAPGSTNPLSNPDARIVPTAKFDQDIDVHTIRHALAHSCTNYIDERGRRVLGDSHQHSFMAAAAAIAIRGPCLRSGTWLEFLGDNAFLWVHIRPTLVALTFPPT